MLLENPVRTTVILTIDIHRQAGKRFRTQEILAGLIYAVRSLFIVV